MILKYRLTSLPILKSDPTRIRQILFNLIGNALKFTEQGGVKIIDRFAVCQRTDDLELQFSVIDTGIGLTKQAQSRVFKKFAQADRSVTRKHGGTGLGLAISRKLAKLLGGKIGVESENGTRLNLLVYNPLRPGRRECCG